MRVDCIYVGFFILYFAATAAVAVVFASQRTNS